MYNNLSFELNDMKILHYEVGNLDKVRAGNTSIRPVCALMLLDKNNKHKVKILFKGDKAVAVDNYIKSRKNLGNISDELVYADCEFREQRKDCVVLNGNGDIWFAPFIGV